MNPPVRICVVGSANVDLTFRTRRLPVPGETLAGHGFHLGFGGKGANQALMAHRLGAQVDFIARVGNDAFGQETLRHYKSEGMEVASVRTDEALPTGVAAIVVDDSAQNCIIVVAGANAGLSPRDIDDAGPVLRSAHVLVGQLETPLETIAAAFRAARTGGVRTILNPAPAVALPADLLPLTDLCVPNETEIEILTGRRIGDIESAAGAARLLRERGAKDVIVTLAERGALVLHGGDVVHVPAVPVIAVDPTAAGDAFIGSLAVFWAQGHSLVESARRANAVAALTVTRHGAQSALPSRDEVAAFLPSV